MRQGARGNEQLVSNEVFGCGTTDRTTELYLFILLCFVSNFVRYELVMFAG